MRRTILATSRLIAMSLLVASCTRAPEKTTPDSVATAESARVQGIVSLGHHAEDLYDHLNLSNWSSADTLMESLRHDVASGVAGNAPTGLDARVSATMARLDTAVAAADRARALIEANRLTELSARLLHSTEPIVPTDVTLLDYFGRELEIRHALHDGAGLQAAADSIRVVWGRVRPSVVARGGAAEAARFDSLVTRLNSAGSPGNIVALGTPILDHVDLLEAVYERP